MYTFQRNIQGPDFNTYFVGVKTEFDRKEDIVHLDIDIEKYVADDRYPFDKMKLTYHSKKKYFDRKPELSENGKFLRDTITKLLFETEGEYWGFY